ncbi:MAG: hypothetical protein IPL61_23425 [Myxococcales bacterium]|nr:hypothetical protein [Myxococcales bacterium]
MLTSPRLAALSTLSTLAALVAAAPAHAQPIAPAPSMPVPPAAAPTPWSPVDDDGWPRGVSLESLRGLRPCRFGEVMPGPGARIPCRPAATPDPVQWRWGIDWTNGVALDSDVTTGAAQALGVELDFTFGHHLALGARYELMGVGLRTTPDDVTIARAQRFFAQARWRAFTDEVDRDAWALAVGGGYALNAAALGDDAPLARVALAREVGMYLDDENAAVAALEVAYTRRLGRDSVDTVAASLRIGFEFNIKEPGNVDQPDQVWSRRVWTGADVFASPVMFGMGASLGLRLADNLHLVASGNYVFGRAPDTVEIEGLHGTVAALGGVRLGPAWPAPAPLYLQVQAGPGLVATDRGLEQHLFADAEFGVGFRSCGGRVSPGVRLRGQLDDGVRVLTGAFVLSVAWGAGAGDGHRGCGGPAIDDLGPVAYMPMPPPEPTPIAPPPPEPTSLTGGGTLDGSGAVVGGGGGTTVVSGGAQVDVVVTPPPPPQPFELDVSLGAVFLGGAIQVRIDPRVLPLARLRGVDVDVRVEGPAAQLARFTGELSAVLGREGITARGWAQRATSSTEIHAIFTIYPPGSR